MCLEGYKKCQGKCGHPGYHPCPGNSEKCGRNDPGWILCNPRFASRGYCPTEHHSRRVCEKPNNATDTSLRIYCAGKKNTI